MHLLNSKNYYQIVLAVMFLAVAVLGLISLLMFKNRMRQKRINGVNILVNLILFGLLIFNLLSLSGEFKDSLKGIGIWLPLGSIVLLFLANRAIQKDENLVKSVDRIR
jgi:ABC-type sugar transport system permease subunit